MMAYSKNQQERPPPGPELDTYEQTNYMILPNTKISCSLADFLSITVLNLVDKWLVRLLILKDKPIVFYKEIIMRVSIHKFSWSL